MDRVDEHRHVDGRRSIGGANPKKTAELAGFIPAALPARSSPRCSRPTVSRRYETSHRVRPALAGRRATDTIFTVKPRDKANRASPTAGPASTPPRPEQDIGAVAHLQDHEVLTDDHPAVEPVRRFFRPLLGGQVGVSWNQVG
jgi:hypothetical protein